MKKKILTQADLDRRILEALRQGGRISKQTYKHMKKLAAAKDAKARGQTRV